MFLTDVLPCSLTEEDMTKIVFMGTPDFAVGSLKTLVET